MTDIETSLQRSAAWSFASLALQAPDAANAEVLASLIPSLDPALQPIAQTIAATPIEEWEPEYFSVLGPGGCPASESSYERAAIASRGPLIADVAGCYEAFAYAPDAREVPDHASIELGFVAYLWLKHAFALHECRNESAAIARDAATEFQASHIGSWLRDFCAALTATGSPLYSAVAEYVRRACAAEAQLPSNDLGMPAGLAPVRDPRCR